MFFSWNRDVVAVFSYSDFRVYVRKQDAEQWLEIGEKVLQKLGFVSFHFYVWFDFRRSPPKNPPIFH